MKTRFMLSAVLMAALCVGCATTQTPADPTTPPPAAPHFSTPPPEVSATTQLGGILLQIYRPDTRTLYMWTGVPKPDARLPMNCFKVQLSDTPSGTPQRLKCE
jgi:hypothetical protein